MASQVKKNQGCWIGMELIRDLSGHVNDISDETLLPVNIEKLKKIDFNNSSRGFR